MRGSAASLGRGRAYHQNRQFDLAMADYTRAIASSGHDWHPHYNRAAIHQMRDEAWSQALRDLNAAIAEHSSNDPSVFVLRGSVHLQKTRMNRPQHSINKAVELAPDNPKTYILGAGVRIRTVRSPPSATAATARTRVRPKRPAVPARGHLPSPRRWTTSKRRWPRSLTTQIHISISVGSWPTRAGTRRRCVAYSAAIRAEPNIFDGLRQPGRRGVFRSQENASWRWPTTTRRSARIRADKYASANRAQPARQHGAAATCHR